MARAVRFTKPEREWMRGWLTEAVKADGDVKDRKAAKLGASVLAKLSESEHPKEKSTGLTVQEAVAAFRSVLDRRLVPPLGNAFGRIQVQLKSLGLTREQCITAAEQAGRQWKGSIKAQSIVNQAETLLHNAESEPLPWTAETLDRSHQMDDL